MYSIMSYKRRQFLKTTTLSAISGILLPSTILSNPIKKEKIRVLVWDERSDSEKEGYPNFLGNCIADQFKENPDFSVASAGLEDRHQGLSDEVLDNTDILIWWGHTKHDQISVKKGKEIVRRIQSGKLSFIALHSAHWSTPFVQCMYEITKLEVLKDGSVKEDDLSFVLPYKQLAQPKYDTRLTPYTIERKFPDGRKKIEVFLPYCCFPAVRNDGKPSTVNVLQPSHPIMKGLPSQFNIPQTEMYDEPFHVPKPDQLLFEESWATGEWFRSGMIWNLGAGKIFYFRPGHETYPVFKESNVMQIITNAVYWMA
ncbi:MAG: trehalose utilization protein [Chitinophagaceae bacterium]|nr:MAG: trehalose utilization protein [Chitinophagaceae bacterium]